MATNEKLQNKFVQYFMVSGLDVNFGLEPDEILHSLDLIPGDTSPLDRSYKPRILRHYPDMTSWSHFNPEALSRLCLPNGLRFSNDKSRYPPSCHPFVLTKEDGSKSCGFSLVYLEEVKDLNVCHALHSLQKMHNTETECGTIKKTERVRPSSAGRQNNARSRSLPRHYTTRLSGSTLELSTASYDYRNDTLYATKSISLICSLPLQHAASQVLHSIHRFINRTDYDINILESFIYNLLYDIPLPSPGRSVRFWCLGEVASISLPKVPVELDLFDYPLIQFFDLLGVTYYKITII
ncbi:DENN domain-containing protein 5B, partial [Eurytemora carolleeae]|uniref:DENN domain-containing protein 5B n=1 Tax=Eurytemora carolleeae TaxID=1294199 RepID=UPI000C767233